MINKKTFSIFCACCSFMFVLLSFVCLIFEKINDDEPSILPTFFLKIHPTILMCRSGVRTLGEIVMKACEESLLPMLWDTHIERLISGMVDAKSQDELALVAKMRNRLEGLPQSFFDITEMYDSPSRWSAAALEMSGIASATMPTDKLAALLRAAKVIYGTFKAERMLIVEAIRKENSKRGKTKKKIKPPPNDLGADEFLPIFIFVTVHAQLDHPLRDKECMWTLCEPDMIAGEGGYYLTVFDAALAHIEGLESGGPLSDFN